MRVAVEERGGAASDVQRHERHESNEEKSSSSRLFTRGTGQLHLPTYLLWWHARVELENWPHNICSTGSD